MRSVVNVSSAGWTLNRALGLDTADRSPIAPGDLPEVAVFSEMIHDTAPAPANAVAAIQRQKALPSKTPAHHGLVVDEVTDLHIFNGVEQLVAVSHPGALGAITWSPVAMEPTALPRPMFGHHVPPAGYGVVGDARVRGLLNLGPVPDGYLNPDVSAGWLALLESNGTQVNFHGTSHHPSTGLRRRKPSWWRALRQILA